MIDRTARAKASACDGACMQVAIAALGYVYACYAFYIIIKVSTILGNYGKFPCDFVFIIFSLGIPKQNFGFSMKISLCLLE